MPQLLFRACDRLRVLAGKGLSGFPALRRWVETDDVLQQAMLRLHRSLQQVRPSTVSEFFALAGSADSARTVRPPSSPLRS